MKAKATLFAMARPQLDQIDDYDSEEEEAKEVEAEQEKAKKKQQTTVKA